MSKKDVTAILVTASVLCISSIAMAGDESLKAAAGPWAYFGIALVISCAFAIGIAALGTSLAMGYAINGALTGVARNPEAGGRIFTMLVLGLALMESLCIYALLISLIMVFKIPDLGTMTDAIVRALGA